MAEIRLEGITKTFDGKVRALRDIDLLVPDRVFLTVLGPSGCGKTTLLRIIAGLEFPDGGQVFIEGKDVTRTPAGKREIAMVFQNYALYPHKTVFDNIALGLKIRGVQKEKIRKKVEEVAWILGMEELLRRFPKQLSGGQQQRTALARALVRNPMVFLLDEPLSNLDAKVRESTRTELKRLFKELNSTAVYVTHDQTEAMMLSDIIVVMREGRIIQTGRPTEIYRDPAHKFVAEFIGSPGINLIEGDLKGGRFSSADGRINFDAPLGSEGRLFMGIRPESLKLEKNIGDIEFHATAGIIEPLGANYVLHLKAGGHSLKALAGQPPEEGIKLNVFFSPGDVYFFDAETGGRVRK